MVRSGIIGQTITLGIKFYQNGELYDPFSVGTVTIYTSLTGSSVVTTITPTRVDTGFYQASWSIPSSFTPTTFFDEWVWVAESGMESNTQRYSFDIVPASISVQVPSVVRAEVGCRSRPAWEFYIGLRNVEDVGNGMGLRLSFGKAIPSSSDQLVHYNVYLSDTRFGVFEGEPQAITTEQQVIVNVDPGKLKYFAVRATEFVPSEFDLTDLVQIGIDLYQYPDTLILQNDIDAYGATLNVGNTNGYPEKGFLLVDTEILQYSVKDGTAFFVEDTERGAFVTFIDTHLAGAEVKLWHGIEEQNTVIFEETAAWHQEWGIPREVGEIGQLNVDADGYRSAATDLLTTDLSASDQNTEDFPSYDYKGYHRPSLQATFSGDCVNSYVGGEFNGSRGFFFQDRNLARLDALLQVTGEPLVLLRRKWTGKRCRCMGLRREHPRTRCKYCFSVGFDGGYDRYVNTRPISERSSNTSGFILARVYPYTDDLELVSAQGARQPVELTAWTINIPTLKDRDFVVRFNEDGTEEFRYEVLDVNRNKLFFGQSGKQEFRMRRHDKTDIIYQFDTDISV
jgi:hypothetical protein